MPARDVVEVIVSEVKDLARGSAGVQEVVSDIEKRYGDLADLLLALEWDGADMAYFTYVRKDGQPESVKRNVMPGQLVTALGRGFLPLSLAEYRRLNGVPQLEAPEDVRSDQSERPSEPEPSSRPRPTDDELYCPECDRLFNTTRGIASHRRSQSHTNRVAELAAAG